MSAAPRRILAGLALIVACALASPGGAADGAPAACPSVGAGGPLALPAAERALREGRPITVLAFGSSSTEGAGASAPEAAYPARLEVRLRAGMPGVPLAVLNRGKGGEDVAEMLARLDREVLAAGPTVVVWQVGANAVLRGMDPEAFRPLLVEGLGRLRAAGADVVLMDSQRAPRILERPNHAAFDALMERLAAEERVPLFSRAALMRAWEAAGEPPAGFLVADGLHHNDRGYDCVAGALAGAVLDALHQPALVAGRR